MKKTFIRFINIYQLTLSPETGLLPRLLGRSGPTCVFYPSCSEYGKEVIRKHGVWKGAFKAAERILSCRPSANPRLWLPE